MDHVPTGGPEDGVDAAARRAEQQAEDEIVSLPWDDDLPVALGDDDAVVDAAASRHLTQSSARAHDVAHPVADPDASLESRSGGDDDTDDHEHGDDHDDIDDHDHGHDHDDDHDSGDDMGDLSADHVGGRRNALPRRVESWRSRSATGAIATAIAMGLQQVFEPERRRPAAVAEAPSDPYDDDDPITVDYVPDDAEGTTVHVKPWLLQKGEPG